MRNGSPLTAAQSTQYSEMVGVLMIKMGRLLKRITYSEPLIHLGGSQHNPALTRIGKPSS